MALEIRPIDHSSRRQLRQYVRFGTDLYAGSPYFVPPLQLDDCNTLSPAKNPAFDFCDAQSFLALRDGKPVGRITAIINKVVNQRTGRHDLRFGFLDFIDDPQVVDALFHAAAAWGRARGMDQMVGPMGFSDLDHEGMLVDGFNEVGTMATIYNHPYYPLHMERLGFKKDADWVEFSVDVPDSVPDKYLRIGRIAAERLGLRILKYSSRRKVKRDYGRAIFHLINESFDPLYGYSPLSDRQIDYYIKMYLGLINLDLLTLVVDRDDNLVALGISIQSFSKALQRSRGRFFPLGWWHLLQGWRGKTDTVDLMLIAVKPSLQGKGVNALMFTDLIPQFQAHKFKHAETNVELEDNGKVQDQWQYLTHRLHKRRRSYRKPL